MLAGICLALNTGGTYAYFTDMADITASMRAAKIELESAGTTCSAKPAELTSDTVFSFSCRVKNTGTAAAYIRDTLLVYLDGAQVQADMIELTQEGQAAGKTAPGGYATLSYTLRVSGADKLKGKQAELCVYVDVQAFTEADRGGFCSDPLRMNPLDFTGDNALMLPVRERRIKLSGNYTSGNQAHREQWYRSEDEIGVGDRMGWSAFDPAAWISVSEDRPLICRYELIAEAGTVRSDIYRISYENGAIKTANYDFFTGAKK